MTAHNFYVKHGLSSWNLRYHAKHGLGGDLLETTIVPHPLQKGRKLKLLTPHQQMKAIEYWERHGVKRESNV